MKVYLDNIGVIRESEIDIDGITVITGYNNSGKTTVGKTLNALFSAVENLRESAMRDKIQYVHHEILTQMDDIFRWGGRDAFNRGNHLGILLDDWFDLEMPDHEDGMRSMCEAARTILEKVESAPEEQIYGIYKESVNAEMGQRLITALENRATTEAKQKIKELLELLKDDPLGVKYGDKKIMEYLQEEFYDQIIPVRYKGRTGRIVIDRDGKGIFDITISENANAGADHLYNEINNVEVSRVLMIDDPGSLLDSIPRRPVGLNNIAFIKNGIRFNRTYYSRRVTVSDRLLAPASVYEAIDNEEKTERIIEEIDKVFDDVIVRNGTRVVCKKSRLDIRNLAAGAKLFVILRQLIVNGQFDHKTLLILDEPDDHLHPEWQAILARVLLTMNREMGVKILLTTHSTNMIYAFEILNKKKRLPDAAWHVYDTWTLDDGYSVHYREVNDGLRQVYDKLGRPFIRLREEEYEDDAE